MFLLYIPLSYYTDRFLYNRTAEEARGGEEVAIDVRMFTVGQVEENCYLFRKEGSTRP